MTREKWEKMSDDERRIKVAELCGWRWEVSSTTTAGRLCFGWKNPKGVFKGWGENKESTAGYTLPDYLNDLNAMFELEKLIPREDQIAYTFLLSGMWNVHGRNEFWDDMTDLDKAAGGWDAAHATAAERAEAFVLVMEKE